MLFLDIYVFFISAFLIALGLFALPAVKPGQKEFPVLVLSLVISSVLFGVSLYRILKGAKMRPRR